jgi:hypothetical protein
MLLFIKTDEQAEFELEVETSGLTLDLTQVHLQCVAMPIDLHTVNCGFTHQCINLPGIPLE